MINIIINQHTNIIIYLIIIKKLNFYSPLTCIRVLNIRTNLGNKYFVNIYTIKISNEKLNTTWLRKKKGINCGMCK